MATVPAAPTLNSLTVKPGLIEAYASAGSDGGSPILGYTFQYSTDSGFGVSSTAPGTGSSKTITDLVSSTLYYIRVQANNAVGYGPYSNVLTATTATRTAMTSIQGCSVVVSGGVTVELRSDGAQTPTITLGYSVLASGVGFTAIATVPTGIGSSKFMVPGMPNDLALVADATGNIYIIGRQGTGTATALVLAFRYARTGTTNVWTLSGQASQYVTSSGDPLATFSATYVPRPATGSADYIFMMVRRAGGQGPGSLTYGLINPGAIAASAAPIFYVAGEDPTWLPMPVANFWSANEGTLDVAAMLVNNGYIAIAGNSWSLVRVVSNAITGVAKDADGQNYDARRIRIIPTTSGFAICAAQGGGLNVNFFSASGAQLGGATFASSAIYGSFWRANWDAQYNMATDQVGIYYVTPASGRAIERVDVSPSTFAKSAAVSITTTLGPVGSVNDQLRVQHGYTDERRILLEASNNSAGTLSLAAYDDRSGNIAPSAPTLVPRPNFDATLATTLAWSFADTNALDTPSAYAVEVQRVSDSVNIYVPGYVTSAVTSMTLPANSLANGVAYRWRVITKDALGAIGAYSAYSTFTTSALGTLTITNPATDYAALNVNALNVTWTYTQSNGYTQATRRVRLTRLSDNAVVLDTGVVTTAVLSYALSGLASDVAYRLDLDIVDTNAVPNASSRLILTSYATPMTPTFTLTNGVNSVIITVANPAPTGSRPEVLRNSIQRRAAGSADPWVTLAIVGYAGTYTDRTVANLASVEYRVIGSDV